MLCSKSVVRNGVLYLLLGSLCGFLGCSKPDTNQASGGQTQLPPDKDKDKDRDHGGEKKFSPPGTCNDPGTCSANNRCPDSGTCTVIVAMDGGSATATIKDKTPLDSEQPYICASPGTPIVWQPAADGQQFIGDFGPSSPWSSRHNYVAGSSTTPDNETTSNSLGCYKYKLEVCNTVCLSPKPCALQCGSKDPIVIIGQDPKHASQ